MAVNGLERAPNGLREPWLGIWRASLRAMQAQGTWTVAQRPLLDLYITALEAATEARLAGKSTVWDRYCRRALILAGQLALTPRGRKAAGLPATVPGTLARRSPPGPFDVLDGPRTGAWPCQEAGANEPGRTAGISKRKRSE